MTEPWPLPEAYRQKIEDEVKKAAEAIEAYVSDKKASQERIGSIAKRIIDSGKLENYGTEAQEQLKKWAEKYGKEATPKRKRKSRDAS